MVTHTKVFTAANRESCDWNAGRFVELHFRVGRWQTGSRSYYEALGEPQLLGSPTVFHVVQLGKFKLWYSGYNNNYSNFMKLLAYTKKHAIIN